MATPSTPGDTFTTGGAGRGQYLVGAGQPYLSIQEAIDALIVDQGAEPFTTEQRITVVDNGVYEPFRIESDALTPTAVSRLVIEGGNGVLPTISGRKNPSKSGVGGLVGNNVPHVTIRRLLFRDLIKGAVFGVNSHRAIVNQCMFIECGNAGVWFYQADECTLANSVLVNCDHGLAAIKTKGLLAIHNTFFNDSKISREGKKTYCIFFDLQDDRGQGVEDTGLAYLYDNIVYSRSDFGVLFFEKDVKNLVSDWNDWYCPNLGDAADLVGGGVGEIREAQAGGIVHREFVRAFHTTDSAPSDVSWRLRTGQDANSLADDPGFFKPAADGKGSQIDVSLMPSSPILGKGRLGYTLPTWADETIPYYDFNGKQRLTNSPAIGAFETCLSHDFFGSLVFGETNNPTEQVDGSSMDALDDCGDSTITPVDKAIAHYAHAIPIWRPRVHLGPFHAKDAQYHLFVKKKTLYIREIQRTTFPLSATMSEVDARVYLGGQDVTDTAVWWIDGYTFTIAHSGIENVDEATEVELQGYQQTWDADAERFGSRFVKHRWRIIDGVQSFVLPDNPVAGEPIVITDDLLAPGNVLGLRQEFRPVYDNVRDETRIEFGGAKNLWPNPDFSYVDEDSPVVVADVLAAEFTGFLPRDHEVQCTGDICTIPPYRTVDGLDFAPLRGSWALYFGPGSIDDYIAQRVTVDPTRAYTFSAYAASMETGTPAELQVSVDFVDREGVTLASHGPYPVDLEEQVPPDMVWKRFGFSFYGEPDTTLNRSPFSDFAEEVNTGLPMPAETHEILVRLHPGNARAALDACQIEEGYRPGLFTRIPKGSDLTVEYETEDLHFHTVKDLSIQPVHNAQARGFLAILPMPAQQWDPDAPAGATTLYDYRWPWGRANVMPWARTSGFSKYRRTPFFSTDERSMMGEPITPPATPALPNDIRIYPSTVFARQGTEGEMFAIEVFDEDTNPYAWERVRATVFDNTGEFPGYLAKRDWSVYTQLGSRVTTILNEAGTASLLWVPPEPDHISYHGPKPTATLVNVAGVDRSAGYVDVPYEVYRPNHGSPVLEDDDGTRIPLEGPEVTGHFLGEVLEDHTIVRLKDFPLPGTLRVVASLTGEAPSTELQESFSAPIPDRHFLVDYEQGVVTLPGAWEEDMRIQYRPRLAWVDPLFTRRIYFDGQAIDLISGEVISVHYDASVQLVVEALAPTGMVESVKQTFLQVEMVAQHARRSAS